MVGDVHAVVVVDGSALIAAGNILHHEVLHGQEALEMEVDAEEDVTEGIEEHAMVLALFPFIAFAVAVEVHHEELRVVLEVMVGIGGDGVGGAVVVDAHEP